MQQQLNLFRQELAQLPAEARDELKSMCIGLSSKATASGDSPGALGMLLSLAGSAAALPVKVVTALVMAIIKQTWCYVVGWLTRIALVILLVWYVWHYYIIPVWDRALDFLNRVFWQFVPFSISDLTSLWDAIMEAIRGIERVILDIENAFKDFDISDIFP